MRIYKTHAIFNPTLGKYWRSGEGFVSNTPDKASRYVGAADAEFVKEGVSGMYPVYELEVHSFIIHQEIAYQKLERFSG